MKEPCGFEVLELSPNESCEVLPLAVGPVLMDSFDVLLSAAEVDAVVGSVDEIKELGVVRFVPLWYGAGGHRDLCEGSGRVFK